MDKYAIGDIVEINGKHRIITAVFADRFTSTIYEPDVPVAPRQKAEAKEEIKEEVKEPEVEEPVKKTRKTTRKRG